MCNEKQREIRFRGKRVDNGEWAEGYYIEAHYHWHNHGVHKEWIVSAACANGGWFALHGRHPVVAGTVGQYTGLKDKNGKKIFEGDILDTPDRLVVVTWLSGNAQFDCNFIRHVHDIVITNFKGISPRDFCLYEVIGNIHDNPELLEEAQHAE